MNQTHSQSFYSLSIQSIDDKEIKMSDFKDKYVLVVNVASLRIPSLYRFTNFKRKILR